MGRRSEWPRLLVARIAEGDRKLLFFDKIDYFRRFQASVE
jgi:hypothetical protein